MRSKPIYVLPEVFDDLRAAADHYESWRSDGREHLFRSYEETVGWIEWNPDLFPRHVGVIQRAILKQSYYIVYFTQETERTLIIAVLDGRRDPSEIRATIRARSPRRRP